MLAKKLTRIVVVGGGLKGWVASSYLKRILGTAVSVTLIQSRPESNQGFVSRTTPAMAAWLRLFSISEVEFMKVCNATFRCATRFVGWAERSGRDSFLIPFTGLPDTPVDLLGASFFPLVGTGFSSIDYWKRSRMLGKRVPYVESQELVKTFFERNRAPRVDPTSPRFATAPNYGFHFDTVAFVSLLRSRSSALGVQFTNGQIENIDTDATGRIQSLRTTTGETVTADLFVDCTGAPNALLHQAVGGRFEDASVQFPCDSVVSFEVTRAADTVIPTYSTIGTLSSGWSFEYPLADRSCCGYVYSSRHTTPEAALLELRAQLGIDPQQPAHQASWKLGRSTAPWVKNCVAVGNADCAIDDIEGTQLLLLGFQLANLINHLPDSEIEEERAQAYNRSSRLIYDSIQDFVALHYLASSGKNTPFWTDVRKGIEPSQRLKDRIQAFESGLVVPSELGVGRDATLPADIFDQRAYTALLSGLGHELRAYPPILDHMDLEPFAQLAREHKLSAGRLVRDLPEHGEYLRAFTQP